MPIVRPTIKKPAPIIRTPHLTPKSTITIGHAPTAVVHTPTIMATEVIEEGENRPNSPTSNLNILLLGNDRDSRRGRTDAIIIASINTTAKTATLLSVPRDLYVETPDGQSERINITALRGGPELLKETVALNLGIEINYYVRLGFGAFRDAVNTLDGVTVAMTCPLEDWKLKHPTLDPTVEANWELIWLDANVYDLDGDFALWYARSRRTTNDFDRGRRQQQLLRAILEKAAQQDDFVQNIPALWQAFQWQVDTDIPITEMVRLGTRLPHIVENGVQHLTLSQQVVTEQLVGEMQQQVLVLDWEAAQPIIMALQSSPQLESASRAPLTVEVVANNWVDYRLSAENLRWQGFIPTFTHDPHLNTDTTTIIYYGPNRKGSFDWLISWIFHNTPVTLAPNSQTTTDYKITLGHNFNPCRSPLHAPK